jgi:hypothetical protein
MEWQKLLPIINFGIQIIKGGIASHPEQDVPIGTSKSIERQSGIRFT